MIFCIKSRSVDLENYTIKDIPGSSGRLDVISRCILAALLGEQSFHPNTEIWVFLNKYGTYIFDSQKLNYSSFPKNELLLTDYFVKLIREDYNSTNPLFPIKKSNMNIFDVLDRYKEDHEIYIMSEKGEDFLDKIELIRGIKNILFIIGNQQGDLIDSEELNALGFSSLSLGPKSYLASSTIRLIRLFF
ncbi:MAG: hypothetical protein BAJALOKI2v1_360022 [Promethearchaeota archaeon]|nr:MAG: hypothetical protein BAJALOKI2v1_360022 [Candidatus Lokiarchaeota archaeon]